MEFLFWTGLYKSQNYPIKINMRCCICSGKNACQRTFIDTFARKKMPFNITEKTCYNQK